MQSYIIKFCPTKNSMHFEVPRHEFETLRLKSCWKSEANIQKSSAKTIFWKPSQNSNFSGKPHKIHQKAYVMKFSLSDTLSLLTCNCHTKDSTAGIFLWIWEIFWNNYSVLQEVFTCVVLRCSKKIIGKYYCCSFFLRKLQAYSCRLF